MILYYNNHRVSDLINNQRNVFNDTPFVLPDTEELFQKYEKFGLNKYNAVYDRTGHLPHFLNMEANLHPIPNKVENYNRSFWEITEKRCKELLSLDKPIHVMWSGGIDSTYIALALQHFANDSSQVKLFGTYNSIVESGDLFDRRLRHEFDHDIRVSSTNEFNYSTDDIYVSGMCGNQLFGPTDDMFAPAGKAAMFHHTLGTPETIYESWENNVDEELLEFLEPIIANSARKIETVADLRWYCIFNLDWYTAVYEHRCSLDPIKANKIHGFFDSYDFQEWAVSTPEPFTKIKGNPNTHRWQMRDVLKEVFGESHYAENKSKKISTLSIHDPSWVFLLKNYQNLYL